MNSTDNKRAITVGIFVLLGIVIFIVGILVLGGQQKRFVRTVQIKAVFDDVGGLKQGNNVLFSGVKVGTVRRIRFAGQSKVEVDMNIEEKSVQYIRKDARATLSSDGLIGNRIVVIVGGSPQIAHVEEGDELRIQATLSSEQLLDTLQQNNRNLLRITNDIKSIIDRVNEGKGLAGALLRDETVANDFRQTAAGLQAAATNANRMSTSLAQFSAKLNRPGTLANQLVTDTVVFSQLKTSVAQLRQASNRANEITENVRQTTSKLNNSLNANNTAVGALLNDPQAGQDLKGTLRNLNSSSAKLDENMEALQHNFLFRGYFRRKAREKEKEREAQRTDTTRQQAARTD